jgi:hypothetical protein
MNRGSWVAHPNYLVCQHGHPLRQFEKSDAPHARWRADLRQLVGHAFFRCCSCEPDSFFFAVFVREPSSVVWCYAIGKEDYLHWQGDGSNVTLPTLEMLHRLRDPVGQSHHPEWRNVP